MAGVFAISRDLLAHEIFADEPFTEREAFIWLVGEAAWKPRRVRVGRALIDLTRGQCAYSLRFMASKWKWSEPAVRRFLNKLKNDAMIDVLSDALATRITICNYDKYQKVSLPNDALIGEQAEELATDSRRKEKSIESIKSNIGRTEAKDLVERLKTVYPKRSHAHPWSKAEPRFASQLAAGKNPDDIVRAAEIYAAQIRSAGQEGSEYVKQITTFCGYWEDVLAQHGASAAPVEAVTSWVQDDDPRWPELSARYERERGRPAHAMSSRYAAGLGHHFPVEWLAA